MRRPTGLVLAVAGLAAGLLAGPALACTADRIAAVIDTTGQKLRQYNSETQPRLQGRMRQLGERNGWSSSEIEEKGYALISDDETRKLDEQAGALLTRLDRLGRETPSCERLAELETVSTQLLEVSAAKGAQMSARLDAALKAAPAARSETAAAEPAKPDQPKTQPQKTEQPKAEPPAKIAKAAPPPPPAMPPAKAPPPAAAEPAPRWQTETTPAPVAAIPELPPRAAVAADAEFSEEDIRAAGRGLFGSISANLASVIEYAFKSYGRPTGYILGSEGGGALVAGLRYGDGMLVTKRDGERRVYWQGPTVGYDLGLTGSQVMFLVYNVRDAEELFARYAGIDGSAYLVGGVGITFLKKGRIVLAPIRSGVGVRLGANIGYLKFTPQPSFNPF